MVIIYSLIAYLIIIAVHQLGHLVMGLYSGFKLRILVIGPFGLIRNERGRFSIYLEDNLSSWSGICITTPQNEENSNLEKFKNIMIAGPIASMIFGILCLTVTLDSYDLLLFSIGILSLVLSIFTLIPRSTGFSYTDGGRWIRIRNGGKDRQIESAMFNIAQSYYKNGDYSKIDIDEIQNILYDDDPKNVYIGHYYTMLYYLDNSYLEEVERQKKYMKLLEPSIPKSYAKYLTEN